jgi:integrase
MVGVIKKPYSNQRVKIWQKAHLPEIPVIKWQKFAKSFGKFVEFWLKCWGSQLWVQAMSEALPRGIQEVQWKNKSGKVQTRWRVRINRKLPSGEQLKFNSLFDDLKTAKEALGNSKTEIGRTALADFLHAESREEKHVFSGVVSEDLGAHLTSYYMQHYQKSEENPIDKKNNGIYLNIVNTLTRTQIQDFAEFEKFPPLLRAQMKYPQSKPFGELNPFEVQPRDVVSYITARLETVKKSTIVKELGFLSSFFNNYHSYSNEEYFKLSENNPVAKANKSKLKNAFIKKDRRLSDNEELDLFNALKECRNQDMMTIFQLAISSGMRRSEILFLQWKQINFEREFIQLERTKNGIPIKIQMLPVAWQYLRLVKKKPNSDRLFTYTQDGFKSNFVRVLNRAKIEHFTFHDLRSEFISRGLSMGLSKFVVTAMLSIKNQASFDRTHLKNHEENERISKPMVDVQRQVNHSKSSMTSHYNRLDLKDALSR